MGVRVVTLDDFAGNYDDLGPESRLRVDTRIDWLDAAAQRQLADRYPRGLQRIGGDPGARDLSRTQIRSPRSSGRDMTGSPCQP